MARAIRFPQGKRPTTDELTALDGHKEMKDLIDELQVLALTHPTAISAIRRYARTVIDST